jgi:hypothetical protein
LKRIGQWIVLGNLDIAGPSHRATNRFLEEETKMARVIFPVRIAFLSMILSISGVIPVGVPAVAMSGSSSTATPPSCRDGWVWNQAKRICERRGSKIHDELEVEREPVNPV